MHAYIKNDIYINCIYVCAYSLKICDELLRMTTNIKNKMHYKRIETDNLTSSVP